MLPVEAAFLLFGAKPCLAGPIKRKGKPKKNSRPKNFRRLFTLLNVMKNFPLDTTSGIYGHKFSKKK
ncbi:hypothetical protein CLV98_10257 [Dyadobacter jejuensis]|uniref:Uncharacterized protein n=1 Tax=Dyadobacter jejuensis TaxID=1082580 RepID=A0A316AN88_9BACT|nr:hypothetical protein CLV98_10257 [Dyadobacter jejuensis]